MRIVLDTNVLVAGLLNPLGPCGQIVDMVTNGKLQVVVDDRIMDEYNLVLRREGLGIDPPDVDEVVELLQDAADFVVPDALGVPLPDESDRMFLEVAVSGPADCIITGNKRHFPPAAAKLARILSPAEFLAARSRRR